jgi:predicted NodU family carbamoyl transferase
MSIPSSSMPIGELLLELVDDIKRSSRHDALRLGGGLFYNTYSTTLIRRPGIFEDVFVPINPGNAGLGVGAPLMVASRDDDSAVSRNVSPFLGPEYDSDGLAVASLLRDLCDGVDFETRLTLYSTAVLDV